MHMAPQKNQALAAALGGFLLITVGVSLIRSSFLMLAPLVVMAGVYLSARGFTWWIRIVAMEEELRGRVRRTLASELGLATLPRQIFLLLLAVAEIDGKAGAQERELVRRFVLERFPDPITVSDLGLWEVQSLPPDQVEGLALRLRRILTTAERETLFYWSCLVAFADRGFNTAEHSILQSIATGFGIPKPHARRLFLHAKHRSLLDTEEREPRARRPSPGASPRARALDLLGLDEGATPAEIRRRHRQLVRKHHPDAHAHLGQRAWQEATERFREIQAAYEELTRAD